MGAMILEKYYSNEPLKHREHKVTLRVKKKTPFVRKRRVVISFKILFETIPISRYRACFS